MSHAELLDTCLFSQKTFEIKTETWVRLGKYLEGYVVSGENENHRDDRFSDKSWCAKLNKSMIKLSPRLSGNKNATYDTARKASGPHQRWRTYCHTVRIGTHIRILATTSAQR